MKDVSDLVAAIEYKISLLLKSNSDLNNQVSALSKEKESLQEKLDLLNKEFEDVKKQNQFLVLNKGVSNKQGSEEAKKNINDFIQEIDRCIALLNE
jgi:uncharacterized coiled-coil protein SlyX